MFWRFQASQGGSEGLFFAAFVGIDFGTDFGRCFGSISDLIWGAVRPFSDIEFERKSGKAKRRRFLCRPRCPADTRRRLGGIIGGVSSDKSVLHAGGPSWKDGAADSIAPRIPPGLTFFVFDFFRRGQGSGVNGQGSGVREQGSGVEGPEKRMGAGRRVKGPDKDSGK